MGICDSRGDDDGVADYEDAANMGAEAEVVPDDTSREHESAIARRDLNRKRTDDWEQQMEAAGRKARGGTSRIPRGRKATHASWMNDDQGSSAVEEARKAWQYSTTHSGDVSPRFSEIVQDKSKAGLAYNFELVPVQELLDAEGDLNPEDVEFFEHGWDRYKFT